jgi:hypothetical protein
MATQTARPSPCRPRVHRRHRRWRRQPSGSCSARATGCRCAPLVGDGLSERAQAMRPWHVVINLRWAARLLAWSAHGQRPEWILSRSRPGQQMGYSCSKGGVHSSRSTWASRQCFLAMLTFVALSSGAADNRGWCWLTGLSVDWRPQCPIGRWLRSSVKRWTPRKPSHVFWRSLRGGSGPAEPKQPRPTPPPATPHSSRVSTCR